MIERELKFRVWDKVGKAMSPEFGLFGEFMLLGAIHDWQIEVQKIEGNLSGMLLRLNDLIEMQYVGFKDANGIGVFEGDIVKCGENIAVVEWDGIRLKPFDYISGLDYVHGVRPTWTTDTVVIGNIHQNPELLK